MVTINSNSRRLSDGRTDGTTLGNSASDPISFHGADPVAQVALSATAAVATTAAASATSSAAVYGFSSAQANGVISLINALRAALITKGLAST